MDLENPAAKDHLVEHLLRDSEKRHQYQHEFSLAGFKTLILLNGGAIISLLTYIGHNSGEHLAGRLSASFIWYVLGLVAVVLAYLAAYFSQGAFLNATGLEAFKAAGHEFEGKKTPDHYASIGTKWIAVGVVLCALSPVAFIVGSSSAMRALS